MKGLANASMIHAPSLRVFSLAGSLPSHRSFANANFGIFGTLPDKDDRQEAQIGTF
jgi:hypothetical protein